MASPSRRRVLVVDDDPNVRETVATLLISAGYDVADAEDGFAALLQLKKMLPDVIVSDLNMPQMSGYELLSVVRRRFPQVMTVAMSGDYQGDAVPSGVIADGFFAKGQSPKGLLATIAALTRTSEIWASTHQKESAPAWIPRNGNEAQGAPYVGSELRGMFTRFSIAGSRRDCRESARNAMPLLPRQESIHY